MWFSIDFMSILPFDILGIILESGDVRQLKMLRIDRSIDRSIDGSMDRWIDGSTNGWMDGWMDGLID